MQNNHRSNHFTAQPRRISIEQAYREATTGLRLEVETTKLSLSRKDSKPCGVFATVIAGPLTGFSGMIYIGDIQGSAGKPAAEVLQDLVNPPGQRLSVAIKQSEIETPERGGARLRLGFWQHGAPGDSQPIEPAHHAVSTAHVAVAQAPSTPTETHSNGAAPAAEQTHSGVGFTSMPVVTVTIFVNGEKGGFHSVKAVSPLVADGTVPELLNGDGEVSTLEAALNLALTLAQEHKAQDIDIVDPSRLLLTTQDGARIRASKLRNLWLATAKRKDAARK